MLKQELIYDKRLISRMVKRGVVSQNDYDQYLKALPDVADKSEPLAPEPESGEDQTES